MKNQLPEPQTKEQIETKTVQERFQILLVDDDANERSGVRFLIEKLALPLDIFEAPNGKRALEMLEAEPVDILFTDVKMPYMDGLELSAQVYARYPNIKIIIFSAYGEFEYAKRAMEANAVNYLLKPVEVAEFQQVMDYVLERCRQDANTARQRDQRSLAVKKLHWINLLTGKSRIGDEPALEVSFQGAVQDVPVVLLHIETQREELSQNETEIVHLLADNIPYPYEYINIYPNSSYILLFADCSKDGLAKLALRLIERSDCFGETPSVLLSTVGHGLGELNTLYQQLNGLRLKMCVWEAPVLFASDFDKPDQVYLTQVEEQLKQTMGAVRTHDREHVLQEIHTLLDVLSMYGMVNVTYMHHIVCEVLGKLYAEGCLANGSDLQTQIYRFSNCRSKASILDAFEDILSGDPFGMPNTAENLSHAIQKVIQIIKTDYGKDLSLDYLAACVGFAPSYLSFIFKHETGENLIKYLTDYRMKVAKSLLDASPDKIGQVAQHCGYSNASYFNRLFKNTYGITPKQYREKKAKA